MSDRCFTCAAEISPVRDDRDEHLYIEFATAILHFCSQRCFRWFKDLCDPGKPVDRKELQRLRERAVRASNA